jgi:hypothetical protein
LLEGDNGAIINPLTFTFAKKNFYDFFFFFLPFTYEQSVAKEYLILDVFNYYSIARQINIEADDAQSLCLAFRK